MRHIARWWRALICAWGREYRLIYADKGVLLFFLALPLLYPITYTLIYNPEVCTDIKMALVDDCRTDRSRQLSRMVDATEYIEIDGYASDMEEAREWMRQRRVYGILHIPSDYDKRIARGEQAVLPVYTDMSLLLRYRSILLALTDVQMQLGEDLRTEAIDYSPATIVADLPEGQPPATRAFLLGDPTQGFASFIMIGLVILILQQSIVLGVLMLGGGSRERRRANGGVDPMQTGGPVTACLLGRTGAIFSIYMPVTVYMLHYVPLMFRLPQIGSPFDFIMFAAPIVLASIFMGMVLQPLVTERESSFLVFVFSSVAFLFLSGLTWPREVMSSPWAEISGLLPATWGIRGFIGICANGATLSEVSECYLMLWILAVAMFIGAVFVTRWMGIHDMRKYSGSSASN